MRTCEISNMGKLDYSGSEAINTICSNIAFAGRDLHRIVITSCNAGDGKSYMSMHIAHNLAQRGKRVVMVDCDLRKSNLISNYGIIFDGEATGLVHYLVGYNELEDILYATNVGDMHLIPIGRDVANPLPLLDSPAYAELIGFLTQYYDYVLVDAPPVGLVIDAAEIAKNCDGSLLVVRYNHTHRRELLEAKRQLLQSGTPILGCVLNDVTFEGVSAKRYYNKSYYSHYGDYYRKSDKKKT